MAARPAGSVVGIDPGTRKCGLAVVERLGERPALLEVVALAALDERLRALTALYHIGVAAVGRGTNAAAALAAARSAGLPRVVVDERETTLRARARFFADHPPRGWRRFVPRGLLLPERPVDDYAALLIAERYLSLSA